jgi:diguanylate cyclase
MTENLTFLPAYETSAEKNAEYLRRSLPLMMKNSVPANPINYAIWYDYVSGENSKLVDDVDSLISDQKAFDSETSFTLYKKHICNASLEIFEKINQELHQVLTDTAKTAASTNAKASEADDSFTSKISLLENIESVGDIKVILSEIISETQSLAASSSTLKTQLQSANQELEQMRNELVKVREVAVTDGLTGLLNRRAFDDVLHQLVENAGTASFAMLDLDHFKQVNDNYGHQVGDSVLKFTASLLKNYAAEHHFVARYGGEELAIIMPDTSLEEALVINEEIRSKLADSRLKRKGNSESIGQITVSIGVSSLKPGDSVDSLICRADEALYKAKETGRNKIVVENNV